MSTKTFFSYLICITGFLILTYVVLNLVLPLSPYLDISVFSLVVFVLFTIGIFFLGDKASKNKAGNLFLYIIILNVFLKLLGSFALVFLYVEIKSPASRLFIIPFLIIYLVFTIFETYFLSLQAQNSK